MINWCGYIFSDGKGIQTLCTYICSVAQSCPTLCEPLDCSLPGSSVHGILGEEYWSGLQFSSPGDLPKPGIKPVSLMSPALAGEFFTTVSPGKPKYPRGHIQLRSWGMGVCNCNFWGFFLISGVDRLIKCCPDSDWPSQVEGSMLVYILKPSTCCLWKKTGFSFPSWVTPLTFHS